MERKTGGSGEWCRSKPGVWVCLSVLLLGWDRAHAEMRVKDLGQCYRDLDEKAKRWSNCRTLHKRRTRKKKKSSSH